ncbi:MAG: threonine/serine dehydratase [Acidimicrobiia bacterium]
MSTVTIAQIRDAANRISRHVHRTPVMTSRAVDDLVGATVYLKCENLQRVGAFKARGATNAIMSLTDAQAERGVITHSSGNHGQAVAYAARMRGIPATVVMPNDASRVKMEAVRSYGAHIVLVPALERAAATAQVAEATGAVVVHPFDDPSVIAGQGTVALELIQEIPRLDLLAAPIGGGGLLSGTAIVAGHYGLGAVGAEPEQVDDAFRSLRDRVRYPATGKASIADGLLTGIGELPFAILSGEGTRVLVVSEAEIMAATRFLAERMKLIVEPSGAVVLAALLRYRDQFAGARVGAILSGGNMDLSLFSESSAPSDHDADVHGQSRPV